MQKISFKNLIFIKFSKGSEVADINSLFNKNYITLCRGDARGNARDKISKENHLAVAKWKTILILFKSLGFSQFFSMI